MATASVTIEIDAEVLAEAQRRAAQQGLAPFVEMLLRVHLQGIRLREAEAELAARYGPIGEEAARRAAVINWPT